MSIEELRQRLAMLEQIDAEGSGLVGGRRRKISDHNVKVREYMKKHKGVTLAEASKKVSGRGLYDMDDYMDGGKKKRKTRRARGKGYPSSYPALVGELFGGSADIYDYLRSVAIKDGKKDDAEFWKMRPPKDKLTFDKLKEYEKGELDLYGKTDQDYAEILYTDPEIKKQNRIKRDVDKIKMSDKVDKIVEDRIKNPKVLAKLIEKIAEGLEPKK